MLKIYVSCNFFRSPYTPNANLEKFLQISTVSTVERSQVNFCAAFAIELMTSRKRGTKTSLDLEAILSQCRQVWRFVAAFWSRVATNWFASCQSCSTDAARAESPPTSRSCSTHVTRVGARRKQFAPVLRHYADSPNSFASSVFKTGALKCSDSSPLPRVFSVTSPVQDA